LLKVASSTINQPFQYHAFSFATPCCTHEGSVYALMITI
jgi:hypothetical protein